MRRGELISRTHMINQIKDQTRCSVRLATAHDREAIYHLRHEVYASELSQHDLQPSGRLSDPLDDFNIYLVSVADETITGFISITPPTRNRFSIDKYISRAELPFAVDDQLFEVRLLTVPKSHRGESIAVLLMYAALRWVEAHGGTRIVAIGRQGILDFYMKLGLEPHGRIVQAGSVTYELMSVTTHDLGRQLANHSSLLNRLERTIDWRLDFPFWKPASCFHGGTFFNAIGTRFDRLELRHEIINADVLDAWFPPSPKVIDALQNNLAWLVQTSPPTGCEGLIETIAEVRGIDPECILPGGGSSDLIFLALRHWLRPQSRVLLLDPTYGEYAHLLEQVIHCRVERFPLSRENGYEVDLEKLEEVARNNFDLIVLVNPNSPTGRHVSGSGLKAIIERIPVKAKVWIDETYIDYVGADQSLEAFATNSPNIIVCKSMSKVYALSGARVAYLCASPELITELRAITPPWAIGLPSQVAAVMALQDQAYYQARYVETHRLRKRLSADLEQFEGWEIIPGVANFLLCHLPAQGPDAATVVERCGDYGLFLRNAATMGKRLGDHAIRIAVKDAETNRRMIQVLKTVLEDSAVPVGK